MTGFKIEDASSLHPEEALRQEWLETNGMGGYASSTILNCNTRKYHGLLVANLKMPPGRHVLLSRIEDSVTVKGQESFLSCCQYPGVLVPEEGHFLKSFQLNHHPLFVYETDHVRIHKAVMMVHHEDCILVRYDIKRCLFPAILTLKPFIAYRGYHDLSKQNAFLRMETDSIHNGFMTAPYDGMPPLYIQTSVQTPFIPFPLWYNNFEYFLERERGYECHEDLFHPGIFEIPVTKGSTVILSASLNICPGLLKNMWDSEAARRRPEASCDKIIARHFTNEEDKASVCSLIGSGRKFLIRTPMGRPTIIAGYHWFTDWGRDTLISLPGLTFCRGLSKEGISILVSIGRHEKEGILPNFFSDYEEERAYNTVDTSLLYFWAVQQMLTYTGEREIIRKEIWPVLKSILMHYTQGTLYNIHMTENGLLFAGDERTHLTWMDAVVEGKPVTPRWGYAVEINALWFNALCFAAELARLFGERESLFSDLAKRTKKSFIDTFWIDGEDYLGDVYCNGSLDRSVRPNQIFAASLTYSPLNAAQCTGVVNKVHRHLLTPVGLRTLSPEDKKYEGRYEGDGATRDRAYHQGTVWPWLMSPFGEAYLRVADDKSSAKTFLRNHIISFIRHHLPSAGIGCVSEIFDGDPPHRPNGCIAQAWSTAGLIRLYTLLDMQQPTTPCPFS